MTAKQLSYRTGLSLSHCMNIVWELWVYEVVTCLTPAARNSRLYWLTDRGKSCQRQVLTRHGQHVSEEELPALDWNVYRSLCFSQRAAVIKALARPMQPSQIAKQAKFQNPALRMSANNTRDVIKVLLTKEVVTSTQVKGKAHRQYALTELGKACHLLLWKAETRP